MTRQHLACGVAAAHLSLVAVGAAGLFQWMGEYTGGRAAGWYGAMTGADAGYGFFAPDVGPEVRVRFAASDGRGREWQDDLTSGLNQEGRLRVGSMTRRFPTDPAEEPLRRDLAASWAATMFGRYPEARAVSVWVEVYEVPSVTEYRAGRRPAWVRVYFATFATTAGLPEAIP